MFTSVKYEQISFFFTRQFIVEYHVKRWMIYFTKKPFSFCILTLLFLINFVYDRAFTFCFMCISQHTQWIHSFLFLFFCLTIFQQVSCENEHTYKLWLSDLITMKLKSIFFLFDVLKLIECRIMQNGERERTLIEQ